MLISLAAIAAVTLGGMSLTYLAVKESSLMWRLAAGNVIGSAVLGVVVFAAAYAAGFNTATAAASLIVAVLPVAVFFDPYRRGRLKNEWAKAKGKFQGVGAKRLRASAYYAFFFVLFWFFFDRAMFEMKDGLYTGGSNNLGDLPFHLGAILGFTDGNNFPPQNPSWAGARFSYPFIADLLTACFVKLGSDVRSALVLQDVTWAMSLLVILERFAERLTGSKLVGRIAPALLFFTGGLGFVWFLKDWWTGSAGLWDILWHLPHDYTISNDFRWGNSMVVLFITQRSLLLGMPLTLLALNWLWKVFSGDQPADEDERVSLGWVPCVLVGLLAGTLPLIHLHSLAVLFVATAFLFAMRPSRWKEFVLFGAGVAVVAIPELVWSLTGSATKSTEFFGFNWGWDKGDDDYFLWFWLKNTGLAIPALVAGAYLFISGRSDVKEAGRHTRRRLLLFYAPFAFLFVLCNVVKLAPWEWDNIKLLIYWFLMSTPLMAYAVVWLWERKTTALRAAAFGFAAVLVFAGALDVFRTATGQIKIRVFDRDAMQLAEQLKQRTEPGAIFLNAPTYNSAIVLSGRQSVMRYSGHLSSHGIDYLPREDDVRRIYQGGGVAEVLIRKYNIGYVLISPEEAEKLHANEDYFRKFQIVAESGPYRVFKVK